MISERTAAIAAIAAGASTPLVILLEGSVSGRFFVLLAGTLALLAVSLLGLPLPTTGRARGAALWSARAASIGAIAIALLIVAEPFMEETPDDAATEEDEMPAWLEAIVMLAVLALLLGFIVYLVLLLRSKVVPAGPPWLVLLSFPAFIVAEAVEQALAGEGAAPAWADLLPLLALALFGLAYAWLGVVVLRREDVARE